MDYNYFNPAATSAAQQYSYLNYGSNDAGVPSQVCCFSAVCHEAAPFSLH